jgi:uncharacterized RDD family membrane protein YckC
MPSTITSAEPRLATPLERLAASLIDALLLFATLIVGWLVWSLIVWKRGQTPGKQLTGLYVYNEGRAASRGQMARRELGAKWIVAISGGLAVRAIGALLSSFGNASADTVALLSGLAVYGVIYSWLCWNHQHQELWDLISNTTVVRGSDGARRRASREGAASATARAEIATP